MKLLSALSIGSSAFLLCLYSPFSSAQALAFDKSFNDTRVEIGQPTRLVFTLSNLTGLQDAENIVLSDTFPPGLTTAEPSNAFFGCSGGIGSGGNTFNYSGELPQGEMCTLEIDVVGTAPGLKENITEDLTSSLGNSGPARALLVVADVGTPVFDLSFADDSIEVGQITTATYSFNHSLGAQNANSLTFMDVLPGGLAVAPTPNVVNTCSGTVTPSATDVVFAGDLNAGNSCSFSLDIVGVSTGEQENITGELTSSIGNSGPAVDTIEVLGPPIPTLSKSFADSSVELGGTTTLIFMLGNNSDFNVAANTSFTDIFPAGIQLAVPDNLNNTCPGSVTLAPNQVDYLGDLAPNSNCTISVDVEGVALGLHQNVSSELSSSLGNSAAAVAALNVREVGTPIFIKLFSASAIGQAGSTNLAFAIDNGNNANAAENLSFTDNLPAGFVVATPANVTNTCSGGTLTALSGSGTITYSGGLVAGLGACLITVDVTAQATGTFTNITSDLTSTLGNSGPASATITVRQAPLFSKQFLADFIGIGTDTALVFSIDNTASSLPANFLAFSDALPAGLAIATPANALSSCAGGTLTALDGGTAISYSNGSVAAGSSCSVLVDIVGTTLGVQNNISGDLTSSLGNSGPASALVQVIAEVSWNVAGPANWFELSNWDPNTLPSLAFPVNINNGGVAMVPPDSPQVMAQSLNIGVDGGSGSLIFAPEESGDFQLDGSANIGVTFTGSAASSGLLEFGDNASGGLENANGPLRIGVSEADGDADGTFILPDSFVSSTNFDFIQIGVSTGAGSAMGNVTIDSSTSSFKADERQIDIGVAHSTGDAMGIMQGGEIEDIARANIGVAHDSGNASADLDLGFSLLGPSNAGLQGPLNIGVNHGVGQALGDVTQQLNVFGTPTARRFTELNVGIANGTGIANGVLRNSNGIQIPLINVGLNPGGGTATGRVFVDHGLIETNTLTLGSGATLEFSANSTRRASGGGSSDVYAAVNTNTASLAGDLQMNLQFIPTGNISFAVINTSSPTGISGLFDNVMVSNLPSNFVVNQNVQLDGSGNQQLIVELQTTSGFPEWDNTNTGPSAGDWFVGSNWTTTSVPGMNDPAFVQNDGEANADSNTAPGPIQVASIAIGRDGSGGLFSANGVNIEPTFSFLLGQVSPLISAEQTATGTATLNNSNILITGPGGPTQPVLGQTGIIGIGFAQGGGTSVGNLVATGGSLITTGSINVGVAAPIATDSTPVADGQFTFNGAGVGSSVLTVNSDNNDGGELRIAGAIDSRTGPNATAHGTASALVQDATINGNVEIAEVEIVNADGIGQATATMVNLSNLEIDGDVSIADVFISRPNGQATADATVVIDQVTLIGTGGDIDLALSNAFDPGNTTVSAHVTLTDITVSNSDGFFDIGEADASDGGIAQSTSTSHWTRTNINTTSDFEVGFADTSDDGSTATLNTTFTMLDSHIQFDDFEVGQVDSFEASFVNSTVMATFQNGSLSGANLDIAESDVFDDSQSIADINFNVSQTTINLSEDFLVGEMTGLGTNPNTQIDVDMSLSHSSVNALDSMIAARVEGAGNLNAQLLMDNSYLNSSSLMLGESGAIDVTIASLDRATAANVANNDVYSAIDIDSGTLNGQINARFDFVPPPGRHSFDLLRATGTLNSNELALSVSNLPALFQVVEFAVQADGGSQVLRLTIEGGNDLAISKVNNAVFIDNLGNVTYIITIVNQGGGDVFNVQVSDVLPNTLDIGSATWTCSATPGASCTVNGNGHIDDIVDIPQGGSVVYSLTTFVLANEGELISNTATVTPPPEAFDVTTDNNSDSDDDPTAFFFDSFEDFDDE